MPTLYRPGQEIDHYKILRLLGKGAASRVYAARDQLSGQEVVLKFPLDDIIGGAAIYERYRSEAEIGQMLDSPLLQRHLNSGEQRSTEYLVLEYMQGKTLREVMMEQYPALLPRADALAIIIHVCEAVACVHAQGIIHQDIKPENIFLLENGDMLDALGHPIKLFDFGIAIVAERERTRWRIFPQLVGTPDYMAPERLQGKTGTVSSDVYAVGIVLYELLCGRTPFQEIDGFAFVSQHVSHDPPDILRFQPDLSPALASVVMHAIRRNPDKRYSSLHKMKYDLCHLEDVVPTRYVADRPLLGGSYRMIFRIAFVVLFIFCLLISLGVVAQTVHHVVR